MLPRGGGGGILGRKHSNAWSLQCIRLKNSLAVCLKDLYDCLELGKHLLSCVIIYIIHCIRVF